jgi:hypothetical protein
VGFGEPDVDRLKSIVDIWITGSQRKIRKFGHILLRNSLLLVGADRGEVKSRSPILNLLAKFEDKIQNVIVQCQQIQN